MNLLDLLKRMMKILKKMIMKMIALMTIALLALLGLTIVKKKKKTYFLKILKKKVNQMLLRLLPLKMTLRHGTYLKSTTLPTRVNSLYYLMYYPAAFLFFLKEEMQASAMMGIFLDVMMRQRECQHITLSVRIMHVLQSSPHLVLLLSRLSQKNIPVFLLGILSRDF